MESAEGGPHRHLYFSGLRAGLWKLPDPSFGDYTCRPLTLSGFALTRDAEVSWASHSLLSFVFQPPPWCPACLPCKVLSVLR